MMIFTIGLLATLIGFASCGYGSYAVGIDYGNNNGNHYETTYGTHYGTSYGEESGVSTSNIISPNPNSLSTVDVSSITDANFQRSSRVRKNGVIPVYKESQQVYYGSRQDSASPLAAQPTYNQNNLGQPAKPALRQNVNQQFNTASSGNYAQTEQPYPNNGYQVGYTTPSPGYVVPINPQPCVPQIPGPPGPYEEKQILPHPSTGLPAYATGYNGGYMSNDVLVRSARHNEKRRGTHKI